MSLKTRLAEVKEGIWYFVAFYGHGSRIEVY